MTTEYTKIVLPEKRSRRTFRVDLAANGRHVVIDIPSVNYGSDSNYLAILAGDTYVQFAFGGYYYEQENPTRDPLPGDDDFHTLNALGHYEVDGRMFNQGLRLWLRGDGACTIVY